MIDRSGDKTAVSAGVAESVSRRRLLAVGAAIGIAGGLGGLVGAQDETGDIELEGEMGGWVGVAPAGIDGETNPTLDLETEVEYTITWTNTDGMPHNVVIEDQAGATLLETEIIDEGSQTVEFTATEAMAEYYCGVHPGTMRGDLAVTADDDAEEMGDQDQTEEDDPDEDEIETETDDYGTEDEETGDDAETDDDGDESEMDTDDDAELAVDLPREYRATLSGDAHGVETDAVGVATFEVHDHEEEMDAHYTLTVEGICDVTQAHIHLGGDDEDGPVVAWLYPETGMEPELLEGRFSGTLAEGTITDDDLVGEWEGTAFTDTVATFEAADAYVNVHTEDHPGGEIRGQIRPTESEE